MKNEIGMPKIIRTLNTTSFVQVMF